MKLKLNVANLITQILMTSSIILTIAGMILGFALLITGNYMLCLSLAAISFVASTVYFKLMAFLTQSLMLAPRENRYGFNSQLNPGFVDKGEKK